MENRKPTQADRVLRFMQEAGSISTLDAFKELGVTRLSARIWELRHYRGLKIESQTETSKNRWGERVTYFRYRLIED